MQMQISFPILILAFMAVLSSNDSEAIDSPRCQITRLTILAAARKGCRRQDKILGPIKNLSATLQNTSVIASRERRLTMQVCILLAHRPNAAHPIVIDDLIVVPWLLCVLGGKTRASSRRSRCRSDRMMPPDGACWGSVGHWGW